MHDKKLQNFVDTCSCAWLSLVGWMKSCFCLSSRAATSFLVEIMSACLCIGALLVGYSIVVSGTIQLVQASKDNPVLHHQISIGYLASNILLLLICAYYSRRRQPNPSAADVIYMGFSGVWVNSATIWNMFCDYVYSDTIFGLSVPFLLTPFVVCLKLCLPLMVWWFLGLVYVVLSHGVCSTSTATNDTVSETANSNYTSTRPLLV